MTFREWTVSELIERLSEMPQHYPVAPIVNGTAGVITGVWCQPLDAQGVETPCVLIGEAEPVDPIVPPHWSEATTP